MPSKKPEAAGNHEKAPMLFEDSIEGIRSDHTEAATITPEANPKRIFSSLAFNSFFKKKTVAEPKRVPKNGMESKINIFI